MPQEKKDRIPLWLYPSSIEMVDKTFPQDNCKSRSEFIEKAIEFYCGYISAQDAVKFLPLSITSAVSGAVQSSENRVARLLFKLAVEMSIENEACYINLSPHELYERQLMRCRLCCALNSLPETQGRRIDAHFILGMSKVDIARAEGVSEKNVRQSIERGLRSMREYLKKYF